MYISREKLINIVFSIINICLAFLFPNKYLLSFLILSLSALFFFRSRHNSYLLVLFGIILYVNISLVISEILEISTALTDSTLLWQYTVRNSTQWLMGAQSIVIMLSALNLFFDRRFYQYRMNEIEFKDNAIIFYCGYAVLWIIWLFFSYASNVQETYISNTNTFYEYCLCIVPVLWIYSGNKVNRKILLTLFAILYCAKSMLHGDRSSMIPMIILVYFIYADKIRINIKRIIICAIIVIVLSNIINIYRTIGISGISSLLDNYKNIYSSSLLTSDTVSQSYYTSVVVQLTHWEVSSPYQYFKDFLIGIFLGGKYGNADVNTIVSIYYTNKYGGFYYSWFYFWFGYLGVFCGSLVLGYIIRKTFNNDSPYTNTFKIVLVAFTIRWYVYTPFVLYRSVIFVFSSLYFLCYLFDSLYNKNNLVNMY